MRHGGVRGFCIDWISPALAALSLGAGSLQAQGPSSWAGFQPSGRHASSPAWSGYVIPHVASTSSAAPADIIAPPEAVGRRQAIESAVLGALCGLLAFAVLGTSDRLALALTVGAAVEVVLSATSFLSRRSLIARLSLEPDAYCIAEVAAYDLGELAR